MDLLLLNVLTNLSSGYFKIKYYRQDITFLYLNPYLTHFGLPQACFKRKHTKLDSIWAQDNFLYDNFPLDQVKLDTANT